MGDSSLTEDTEIIMNKEEFEVIDECIEGETPEIIEEIIDSQAEVTTSPKKLDDSTETQDPEADNADIKSHDDNNTDQFAMECDQTSNNDNTDFTADIDLDQFDGQKEVTDEDVMHHLDVIENIELDPETFCVDQCMKEINQSELFEKEKEGQKEVKDEITVIEEEFVGVEWYEKKLAEKNDFLKERLSKLARVLIASYPSYEKWLERIEKIEGSSICKIDPARRCSLKKPNTNRWKFECKKKYIQESIKPDPDSPYDNVKVCWQLKPIGIGGSSVDVTKFPSFVLKAVKIFEDFLQTTINPTEDIVKEPPNENPDNTSLDVDIKDPDQDNKQQWFCLLVRCNNKDELMLFATGKNISRSTMDRLKQTYESGPGRNCNVKSLYCKSLNKRDDKIITTFLVGAEALDESVGGLKVQLAPKTNFWCNAAGAWNVAKAVADMLEPTPKVTILEIGCGIGVIGLAIASKCREVIGIDSPSEIEEAEITCELNKIYNASFIMGSPSEVVNKLNSARDLRNKNRVTYCIINTGTNMGKAIEVMTCLRKITSLRRIVMVTTLTKQSVRAILELARPIETGLGHPFMPIRACVVDTLPTGPHFEVVILMERRLMHRLTQPWFIKMLEEESKTLANTKALEKIIHNDKPENTDTRIRKNPLAKPELVKKAKALLTKKISKAVKSGSGSPGKLKLKRDHSPEVIEVKKVTKKIEKPGPKPKLGQQDITAKKKNWLVENSTLRINPLFDKKAREIKEQVDLREKLLNNRIDTDLIQKVNESREILEAAKEKLSGPSPSVDATTAKELKNVLSLVLDQTNKMQTQLPRSVWDRIAPPELESKKELDDDPLLKGRFVQEIRAQDIVITTANKEYLETEDNNKPKFKKYHNLAPLEPNMVMPVSKKFKPNNRTEYPKKSFANRNRQQNQDNSWNKNKGFDRNRWNNTGSARKPVSPMKRQDLSFRQRPSPSDAFSSKRPLLSPPRRPCSPPRRHLSPNKSYQARNPSPHRDYSQRRPMSPIRITIDDRERQMSPPRPFSPLNRTMSPPRRPMQVSGRPLSPMRRHMSPPRPQLSPSRRQMSSMEYDSSARQLSPDRRPMSPMRMMSPSRSRDMIPPRHQSSPMRHFSPHRVPHIRNASPPRRQQSPPRRQQSPPRRQLSPPRRQNSPPNRFADEWDIPSRGAIEQSSTWQRSINERSENVWHNERQPTTSGNWQTLSDNDRYHKPTNQDKSWDARDSSSHGNSWNAKQSLAKPNMKESWQTSDNRWSGPSRSGNGENWNRNKESLGGRNKEPWMNTNKPRWEQPQSKDWNQGDKEEWNDLPEDARDPWGDEGNLGLKESWRSIDNQATSSTNWSREANKDPWAKSKDNWSKPLIQNKSQTLGQNSNNPNINDSRWLPLNDMSKKLPSSTNWQGSTNIGSNVGWQSNYNFQAPQRPFVANLFKDRR